MHSGIVETENLTLSFILTRFHVSREAPRSISLSVRSRHHTRTVGLFPSPSLMLPRDLPEEVSLSSPVWERQGRKQAEAPRDDSAEMTLHHHRSAQSQKSQWRCYEWWKMQKKVLFACLEPVWPHASIGREMRTHSNKDPTWLLTAAVSPHHTAVQTPRGQPHTANKYALFSISPLFFYFHHICLAFHDFWSLNWAFSGLLWLLIIGIWNWLTECAFQLCSDCPSSENVSADPELPTAINAIWRQFLGHVAELERAIASSSCWETNVLGVGRWPERLMSDSRVLQLCI